jgi:hypothetical protein
MTIFVFGSNESGIHGAGAARVAVNNHGAIWGQGFGPAPLTPSPKYPPTSFAIPTKDWRIADLPYDVIKQYVGRFIVYARMHPELTFQITQLGCGLAGKRADLMAQMFKYAPENCLFDEAWAPFLPKKAKFWGTFP